MSGQQARRSRDLGSIINDDERRLKGPSFVLCGSVFVYCSQKCESSRRRLPRRLAREYWLTHMPKWQTPAQGGMVRRLRKSVVSLELSRLCRMCYTSSIAGSCACCVSVQLVLEVAGGRQFRRCRLSQEKWRLDLESPDISCSLSIGPRNQSIAFVLENN